MKKKLSAALLSFMLVFQVMSSGYLAPFTALANEAPTTQLNDEETPKAEEKTAEEIAAAEEALAKATETVNSLFADADHKNIVEGLDEYRITTVQSIVNKLEDGDDKTKLDELVTKASLQVTANKEKETVKADKEVPATTEKEKEKEVTTAPKEEVKKEDVKKEEEPAKAPKKVKASEAGTDITNLGKIVSGVKIKDSDKPITNGNEVEIEIYFSMNADFFNQHEDVKNGDFIKYKLPTNHFDGLAKEAGEIRAGTDKVGAYKVDGDYLIITFTNIIDDNGQPVPFKDGFVKMKAGIKAIGENEKQEIVFGEDSTTQGSEKVTVNLIPKTESGSKAITKSGEVQLNGQIKWTIVANGNLTAKIDSKIKDILPVGLAFKSIKGKKQVVQMDGTLGGAEVINVATPTGDTFEYTVNDPKSVYTFEIITINNSESENANETFTNTASLDGVDVPAQVTVTYGVPIEKTLKEVDKTGKNPVAKWKIKYNYNLKQLTGEKASVTDVIDPEHKIDIGSIVATVKTPSDTILIKGTDYYVTDTGNGFKIEFLNEVIKGKAVDIEYESKLVDENAIFEENTRVTNTATGGNGRHYPASIVYPANFASKTGVINYGTKAIDWTIVINKPVNPLTGVKITDTYPTDRSLPAPTDVKINGTSTDASQLTENTVGKFVLNLGEVSEEKTITYSTPYDEDNIGVDPITNTASIKFIPKDGVETEIVKTDTVTPNGQQVENSGVKTGEFDYINREIDWTLGVNYKLQNAANAVVVDTLSDNQKLNTKSVKLYEVTLGSNDVNGVEKIVNDISTVGTLVPTAKGFTFTFKDVENKKAYKFKYSSTDAAGLMDKEYTNNATFKIGKKTYPFGKTVTINNFNSFIEKDQPRINKDDQSLSWEMMVNKSQSLLKNAVLIDSPQNNQIILPNTLKIYEMSTENGTNFTLGHPVFDASTTGWGHEQSDFKLEQSDNNRFKITFPKPITKTYKITYDAYFNDESGNSTTNVAELNYDGGASTSGKDGNGSAKEHTIIYSESSAGAKREKVDFKFHKVDATGETALKDAEFVLYNGKGTVEIARGKTDANGDIFFKGFYEGTYQLQEVSAPTEYELEGSQYENKTQIKLFNDKEKGNVLSNPVIERTIANYKKGQCRETTIKVTKGSSVVSGAKVEVKDKNGEVVVLKEATDQTGAVLFKETNAQGEVKLDALYTSGKYQVEVTVDGLTKVVSQFDIAGCEATINFAELACAETLLDIKYGEEFIKNVEVTIDGEIKKFNENGKIVIKHGELKLDSKIVVKDDLHEQEFTGKELIAKEDCNLTLVLKDTSCKQIEVTIKNDLTIFGNAKVQILDQDGNAQELDTANQSTELKTNDQGKVIIPVKYATGDYNIKVTKTGFKTVEIDFKPHNCEFTLDLNNPANACTNIEITFTGTNLKENKVYVVDEEGNKQDLDEKGTKSLNLDDEKKVTIPTKYANGDYTIVLVQDGKANFVTKIESDDCKQIITVTEESTNGNTCPATTITVKNGSEVIEGAKVVITKTEVGEEATVLFTGTTDDKGKITTTKYVNLSDEEIKVEVYAKGYKTDTAIKISDENCEAVVDLNKNACPDYAINAVDQDGKVITNEDFLKGSEFNIIGDTEVIEGVKINDKGELVNAEGTALSTKELKASKTAEYTLVQTKTAPGFKKLDDQKVQDLDNCTGLVTINLNKTTDPTNPGASCPDFSVIYKGPENTTAEFKIVKVEKTTDAEGKEVVTETPIEENITVKTDEDTKTSSLVLTTKSFEPGEYKLVQTKSHSGFYNAATKEFTVEMGTCVEEIEVTNSPIPPTPAPSCTEDTVVKVTDTDGKKVSTDNAKVIVDGKETPVTTADGTVIIPKDLLDSAKESTIIITLEDGRTTTVVLPKDRVECTADAKVPVLKVCVENPTITVKDKNGKDVSTDKIVKVTVNGKEVTPTIEKGKVVIPKDSVNPKVDSVVTVTTKGGEEGTVTIPKFSENCDYTIVINNTCDALTVNVTENGKKAENGTVSIIDQNGKVVATQKITENGKVTFPAKYVDSSYSVKVTIGKTTQTVPVNANENCEVTVNVKTIACEKATIHVTLDGKPVSGATVITLDKKGNEMDVDATDKKGNVSIDPIYANKDHKFEVTVEEETKVVKFTGCDISIGFKTKPVVDGETEEPTEPGKPTKPTKPTTPPTPPTKPTTPPTNVDGDKEENTGNNTVKPNNKYDIYDEDGNLVEHNATIDKNGQLEAGKLPEGTYTFVNDKGEKVTIKVGKDGKLPQTGLGNTMLFGLAGIALLGAGLFLIGRNRKRNA